mmetsp:Transcript_60791/g.162545  ORF Transcript_60791/g.162545 Transcript_60791/m.162545 type:complete len:227 (+) Transcript_60791:741-1421(+)
MQFIQQRTNPINRFVYLVNEFCVHCFISQGADPFVAQIVNPGHESTTPGGVRPAGGGERGGRHGGGRQGGGGAHVRGPGALRGLISSIASPPPPPSFAPSDSPPPLPPPPHVANARPCSGPARAATSLLLLVLPFPFLPTRLLLLGGRQPPPAGGEPGRGDEREHHIGGGGGGAQQQARQPLLQGEGRAAEGRVEPRHLHDGHLHQQGAQHDGDEEVVLEHPREDV